jgi:hypothetical protein
MNRAERGLLLELFRWARAEGGLQYGGLYRWARRTGEGQRWGIVFHAEDFELGETVEIDIWRSGINTQAFWAKSIAEAVNQLVALGIAPHRFSTAYRSGYDAAMQAHRIARSVPDKLSSPRGWSAPEIFALLPAADTELAVRR